MGNCIDILDAVRAAQATVPYEVIGFLDDAVDLIGTAQNGVPVLGPLAALRDLPDVWVVSGIGSPRSYRNKRAFIDGLGLETERYATIIHPRATVSPSARIDVGSVILANCTICANVRIGKQVMMLPNCVLGHDTVVGDYSIFAAGVTVSGNVDIGASCYLGSGAAIRDGVRIGAESLLGMGAVLVGDCSSAAVMAGNPARARAIPR